MNQREWREWCRNINLNSQTIQLIDKIRSTPPTRKVGSRAKNVSGTYPSQKMGVTIQFESHKVELWAIYQMEHDISVKEYYDQPLGFSISYHNNKGRKIGHYHTPDFFVIRKTEAGWEEWKTEKQLQQLTQKYPTRYQKTENGSWICPPGIAHAESLGLKYYVRSDAGVNPIFIQNLIFLEDYLRFTSSVSAEIQKQIDFQIKATPGITITNLINNEPEIRANDIYTMIANDGIYTDLTAVPLKEHNWVQLYPNHHYYDAIVSLRGQNNTPHLNKTSKLVANTPLVWDGRLWTLVNLGDSTVTLLPETGEVMQLPSELFHQLLSNGSITITNTSEEGKTSIEVQNIINKANPTDLALANERVSHVLAYLQRQTEGSSPINQRTLRRWVFSDRMAEVNYGCGYIGLLPKTSAARQPKTKSRIEFNRIT